MTMDPNAADLVFMRLAMDQARNAEVIGEVPVGAVLVRDGVVVATGFNQPIGTHDPTSHAEINALRQGGSQLANYRLMDCELYVTLEPCPMCVGAMLHARLRRVVFGAFDPKTGAAGGVIDLFAESALNHRTAVTGGVLADECGQMLKRFFADRRRRPSAKPAATDPDVDASTVVTEIEYAAWAAIKR